MAKNKSRDLASDIIDAVREGTKKWTRTVKAEERSPASRAYRMSRMTRERGTSIKEAAAQIMEAAYLQASGNGELPAKPRQIMYAARPHIQKETGKQLDDNYFTQVLLPDYIEEHGVDWDVVWDARGHFTEPHGGESFGIGTLEVRSYLAGFNDPSVTHAGFSQATVKTNGPSGNFGAVLFIEKEGFTPILEAAQIAKRFDVAIMSTKGMSVTAARALADEMCSDHGIPLLLLHDFDKAGFSIAGTLQRDTRRYEFRNDITVVDIGLSLADVEAMGRRVELNAMTSPQFVAFVERKLRANGITKVVPDDDVLGEMYTAIGKGRRLEAAIEELDELDAKDCKPPKNLKQRVRKVLEKHPAMRWDAAVAKIALRCTNASK